MITFFQAVELPLAEVEKTRVTCGSCPVNMACILGQGGNGWKFDCCGMTGFQMDDNVTVAIDCANNGFEQNADAKTWKKCPLCSGGIMEVVERARADGGRRSMYLLTEHAKVPLVERLELWKRKQAEARTRIAEENERRTA